MLRQRHRLFVPKVLGLKKGRICKVSKATLEKVLSGTVTAEPRFLMFLNFQVRHNWCYEQVCIGCNISLVTYAKFGLHQELTLNNHDIHISQLMLILRLDYYSPQTETECTNYKYQHSTVKSVVSKYLVWVFFLSNLVVFHIIFMLYHKIKYL